MTIEHQQKSTGTSHAEQAHGVVREIIFQIRGAKSPAVVAVQEQLKHPKLQSVLGLILGDQPSKVVIESKASRTAIELKFNRDLFVIGIPQKDKIPGTLAQRVVERLVGFAIKDAALDSAVCFMSCGSILPQFSGPMEHLISQLTSEFAQRRMIPREALLSACAPYRGEFEELKNTLRGKLINPGCVTYETVEESTRQFFERLVQFRALSELLGEGASQGDFIVHVVVEYVCNVEALVADAVHKGNYDRARGVVDVIDGLVRMLSVSGCFRPLPYPLQAAACSPEHDRTGLNPRDLLRELTPGWAEGAQAPRTPRGTLAGAEERLLCEMRGAVTALKAGLAQERELTAAQYDVLDLLNELIRLSADAPATVATLGPSSTAEQLAELGDLLKVLLCLRGANNTEFRECADVIISGLRDASSSRRGVLTKSTVHSDDIMTLIHCLGTISAQQPAVAGEKLTIYREQLGFLCIRAIVVATNYYRRLLCCPDERDKTPIQETVRWMRQDAECLERGVKALEPVFVALGRNDLCTGGYEALNALRDEVTAYEMSALSDEELVTRVDDVLRVHGSTHLSAQLQQVAATLTERIKSFGGQVVSDFSGKLAAASAEGSIVPLTRFARDVFNVTKVDPESKQSLCLQGAVVQALDRMIKDFEEYYGEEIARASSPTASVADVYRALGALSTMYKELSLVDTELSKPYSQFLPEAFRSKIEVLIEQPRRQVATILRHPTKTALLDQVLVSLEADMSSRDAEERALASSCIAGLRLLRLPRAIFSGNAKETFLRLTQPSGAR